MIKDITIGQYLPGDSIIHRLDPRTKILSVLFYMTGLFVLDQLESYVVVTAVTLFIIWLSRIPLSYLLKGLKPILIILAFTFGLHLFLTPGTAIWTLGPLKITIEGFLRGTFMALRLIYLILVTSLKYLATSSCNCLGSL